MRVFRPAIGLGTAGDKDMSMEYSPTLLLVDDNPVNLDIMSRIISHYLPKCQVLTARDPSTALNIGETIALDGVLLDCQMPGMGGVELCRRFKEHEHLKHVPVILLTSFKSSPELRAEGLDAGAEDFISRPVENVEFIARIRSILRLKRAEDRLRRINSNVEGLLAEKTAALERSRRMYDMLSACSQAVMMAEKSEDLYRDICRILVNEGGYRVAWVGELEMGLDMKIRPLAWEGVNESCSAKLRSVWTDKTFPCDPATRTAIREGRVAIVRDMDEALASGVSGYEVVSQGVVSALSLPLMDGENLLGVLSLYSSERHIFDTLEISLLQRLADNLVFGIRALEAERERQTSRLKAEQALSLLKSVINATSDLIYFKDREGRFLGCNLATARLFGHPEEEIVGKRDDDFFPSETARSVMAWDQELLAERIPKRIEECLPCPGRGDVFFDTLKSPYYGSDGELLGLIGVSRDISLQKMAQLELQESREEFRRLSQEFQTVLEGIPDTISLLDSDFKILWSNKNRVEGAFTRAPLPGKCYQRIHNLEGPCENCPTLSCFETGEASEGVIRGTNDRIRGVKAFPLKDETGKVIHVITLASDITEKIRMREESQRNSRLAALGELAAGVAHEINNPNGVILLNASLLQKAWADIQSLLDAHYRQTGDFSMGSMSYTQLLDLMPDLLADTLASGRRIKRIVEDLKEFVRIRSA